MTDLLLMSEIKGYVRNPSYYFDTSTSLSNRTSTSFNDRTAHLDLLLMVQGWRRYSWEKMAGIEDVELEYLPEQGIEIHGRVVDTEIGLNFRRRQIPKSNVDVSLMLHKRADEDISPVSFIDTFVTDKEGRFFFVADVPGKWDMVLNTSEKGRHKNYQILLDRLFSPEPRRYSYAELQINIAENQDNEEEEANLFENDFDSFFTAYQDSLAKLGIDEKTHLLQEVTVTAGRNDIRRVRSTSVAYYDVPSELEKIYDKGIFVHNKNLGELLVNVNENFHFDIRGLTYKTQPVHTVINYNYGVNNQSYFNSSIKSIYISEDKSVIAASINPSFGPQRAEMALQIGCAVFIETYPEGKYPVVGERGTRKTWLDGYSAVKEFYSPDYTALPPVPDYRRTLYWNPSVTTDEDGKARIQFYNNSRSTNFKISAETVTNEGMIGVLQ
jgi:hypothetical protein